MCPIFKKIFYQKKKKTYFNKNYFFFCFNNFKNAKKIPIDNFSQMKKKKTSLNLSFENRRKFIEKIFFTISYQISIATTVTANSDQKEQSSFSIESHKIKQNPKKKNPKSFDFLFEYFNFKEENLKILDSFINFIKIIFSVGIFTIFAISFSNRLYKKIDLPIEYDPEKIFLYFKIKPEKIIFRFSQILSESINFSLMLFFDYLFFYNEKKYNTTKYTKYKATEKNQFLNFKKQNVYILFKNNLFISIFSTKEKFYRIENIINFSKIQSDQKKKIFWKVKTDNRAKQLRKVVSSLSPAFIKLAQAFASRPDVVGERISNELQRLQDGMPFFSNDLAFKFIKEELGATPNKIFSEITSSPVAAASLGQVYKAKLDGIQVAVKVQRPGLIELLALDIILIRFLAYVFQKILNIRTDLVAAVDEYGYRLFEELDYRKEASNMIKFRSLYGYMDMIYIPKVFLDFSSQHVLVMEWVEGDRLVKNSVKISQEDISLIEIGVRCSLVQLLEIGFLHCDPHGGNLIKTKEGKLAYIDFGLVSEIPESVRYSLITAILHLLNREYELLARDFTGLALIRNDDLDKEISNFSLELFDIFDKSISNFDSFTFQDTTEKIFRLSVKFPFILPPYFLNNLRAIATLEGIALMADSEFKIVDVIYPYIINRLLTNPAPQFRAALEDFLINNFTMEPYWNRLHTLLQDPEWSEVFSEQSQNLSDTILNFLISPTGSFLKKMVLQDLTNTVEKTFLFFIFNDFYTKISLQSNKNHKSGMKFKFNLKSINIYKKTDVIFPLIFMNSKIYNIKILTGFLKISFISSILVYSELLVRLYCFFFREFKKKLKILYTIFFGRKNI